MLLRSTLLLVALFLANCASLTKEECAQGNWHAIGVEDGQNGQSPAYFSEHQKACKRQEISPDHGLWQQGRIEGLRYYCTPQKQYLVGRSGKATGPYCQKEQISVLQAAHKKGEAYYAFTREINTLEREKNDLYRERRHSHHHHGHNRIGGHHHHGGHLYGFYLARISHINRRIRELERLRAPYASL